MQSITLSPRSVLCFSQSQAGGIGKNTRWGNLNVVVAGVLSTLERTRNLSFSFNPANPVRTFNRLTRFQVLINFEEVLHF